MRFQIQLRNLSRKAMIPINYQYELSAWIYKVLKRGDLDFKTWLHEQGGGSKASNSVIYLFRLCPPRETRVRGYLYEFELSAPPALLQFAYEAGVGEKNSMGFGCVEVVE